MAIHPLHEYFSLLENKQLLKQLEFFNEHETFIKSKQIYDVDRADYFIYDIEWNPDKNGYVIIELRGNIEPVEKLLTKENYINEIFEGVNLRFKNRIRNVYLNFNEKEIIEKTRTLVKELKRLLQNNPSELIDFKIISNSYLESAIQFLNGYTQKENVVINNSYSKKLKWLGNDNTLATLFYDLNESDNNLKTRLIESNPTQLTDFILENFINSDGKDFNRVSIYTYLTHEFKKAKRRFDFRKIEQIISRKDSYNSDTEPAS